jgi:hypothetical protein
VGSANTILKEGRAERCKEGLKQSHSITSPNVV